MSKHKNNIPSEEDFARADAAMEHQDSGLSDVSERILKRFHGCGVHEFFIFFSIATNRNPQITKTTFGAYVFYNSEGDISKAAASGLSAEIKDALYEELTAVGRGKRETLNVTVEFDSHENVKQNYGGNYFNRLR